jgi:Homeodomain-like domain-containing protein
MGSRGKALSENQVRKIISLLASTELTVPEIAERMGCSRSTVVSVNRFHGIRDYQGHRSVWVCNTSAPTSIPAPVQVTMQASVPVKSTEAPGASRQF